MSSRKRPAESRSRGNSPPEKRTRPPERSTSMHNRYATHLSPTSILSASSRTGSFTSPPDRVSTAPQLARDGSRVDPYRTGNSSDTFEGRRPHGFTSPNDDQQRRLSAVRSPLHVQSPGSGSGASTPVHGARPAPSMLPKVGSALAGTASTKPDHEGHTIANGTPISLASVQRLRLRKQAIVNETKDKGKDSPSSARLIAQISAQQIEITYLKKERENMSEKLKLFETRMVELDKMQSLLGRVEALESTTTRCAASLDQFAKSESLVWELVSWKSQQPARLDIEEMIHTIAPEALKSELDKTEDRLANRIGKIESKGYDDQLQNLTKKIDDVERNEVETYRKVSAVSQDIERYIGPIEKEPEWNHATLVERVQNLGLVVGQVKNFQSEQGKLSNGLKKLTVDQENSKVEQEKLLAEQKNMTARVDTLEQEKIGTTVSSPSTDSNNSSSVITNQRLDRMDKNIEEVRHSCAEIDALSSHLAQLSERMNTVDRHTEDIQTLGARYSEMSNRLTAVESKLSVLYEVDDLSGSLVELRSKLFKLEAQQQSNSLESTKMSAELATLSNQISGLNEDMSLLDRAVEDLESKVHGHASRLDVLQTKVPSIFKEKFDPFRLEMEQKIGDFGKSVASMHEDIAKLQQQTHRTRSPSHRPDVELLRKELIQLQTAVASETSARQQAIRKVEHEIVSKADKANTDQQMNRFKLGFRNLQDQYNNITTDELHGRMVHWFLQNYPSNTANMLQQFASLRQDVNMLKDMSAQVSWIQSRSQDLDTLLIVAPQLQEMVKSNSVALLPQALARLDNVCNTAEEAFLMAEAAKSTASEQKEQISRIQQALHNLDSVRSHVAKDQSIQALDKEVQQLRKGVETGFADVSRALSKAIGEEHDDRTNAINEFRTVAGRDHELRAKEMKALKSSILKCTDTYRELLTSVTHLQETSEVLRRDVDSINDEYIKPNLELFGLFGNVLIVVGQLQSLVESINQNLPKAPIAIEWHMDLNDLDAGVLGSNKDQAQPKQ